MPMASVGKIVMSDLDAMHYGRTGKNHNGKKNEPKEASEDDPVGVGDEDLWKQLR